MPLHLLSHQLQVHSFFPAVGPLFIPAVGPLFSFFCGDLRPFISLSQCTGFFASVSTILSSSFLSAGLTSGSSVTSSCHVTLLSCVRSPASLLCECVKLTPRAPNSHHLCSVMPRSCQGLRCFDELFTRPRAHPRVLLCTLLTCCAWPAGLTSSTPLVLRMLCVEVFDSRALLLWFFAPTSPSCSCPHFAKGLCKDAIVISELGCSGSREHKSSRSGDQPEHGCDRAFVCSASASRPRSRRSSVIATLRSCRRCAWLCASWSVGTSRRRHTSNE